LHLPKRKTFGLACHINQRNDLTDAVHPIGIIRYNQCIGFIDRHKRCAQLHIRKHFLGRRRRNILQRKNTADHHISRLNRFIRFAKGRVGLLHLADGDNGNQIAAASHHKALETHHGFQQRIGIFDLDFAVMDFQLNISPHLGRVIHIIEPQLLADQFQKGCNLYFFRQRNSQFQFLFAFRNYRFRRFWGGLDFGFGCGGPACLGQHGLQFGDLLFLPGQLFFQPGQQRRRSRFRFCCGGLCSRCWLSGWCRFDGRFGLFFFGLLPCCTLAKGLNDFCKGLLLIRFSRGGLFFGLNLFLNLLSFLLSRDEGLHQFFTEKAPP